MVVLKPLEVWEAEKSYAAGYLAAAFDGDGHVKQRAWTHSSGANRIELEIGFAQRDNAMLAQVEAMLNEYGFPHGRKSSGGTNGDVIHLGLYQRAEILRFLGSIRPVRLLGKFQPSLLGRVPLKHRTMLVKREDAGTQEVVALTTTTGTFLADGFASG